jgi:uncharacterized membrane protein
MDFHLFSSLLLSGGCMLFYLPLILMIVGTTAYHVAQKSVPGSVNPVFSLVINYLTALVGTLVLIPLYPERSAGHWDLKAINWASVAVGVSIVGVELAVLLAYRSGWRVSLLSVIGNTASALLLVMVGLIFFHEQLSFRNVTGVVLCLIGLTMITQH